MDATKFAPLVLRLGRQQLRSSRQSTSYGPSRHPVKRSSIRCLITSTRQNAAPLPSSSNEALPETQKLQGDAEQTATSTPSAGVEPRPTTSSQRRSLRPWLWATGFIMFGVLANSMMRAVIFPPPLPEPGTEEDEYLLSRYRSDLNNLPIVVELRSHREAWREYDPYSQREAYRGKTADDPAFGSSADVERHMTAGSLQGARGLAVQRAFYNASERREITVVFFGGAVSGWPGVTHGGALATVLKEAVERAANGPAFASSKDSLLNSLSRLDCDSLTLNYKKPTTANSFYIIRAEVSDAKPAAGSKPGSVEVKATIENSMTGVTNVLATATCSPSSAVSKGIDSVQAQAGSLWSSITGPFGGNGSSTAAST